MIDREPPDRPSTDGAGLRPGSGPDGPPPEEVSLLDLAAVLLRHRRVVAGVPLALAALVVVHGLLFAPRTWTAAGSFTPQAGQETADRLRGLASQFGVRLGADGAAQSPGFFADVLRSRELLERVATHRYGEGAAADSAAGSASASDAPAARGRTLVEAYGLHEAADDSAAARADAVERLREDLTVTTDPETGIVEFSVTLPDPGLAHAVADRLLDELHRFNLRVRRSRAGAERAFLEERVERARADLRAAEDSLAAFLENNRRWQNAPALVFERERLQRRVELRQGIYTSLAQSLEEARLDEVRSTPVITVVERPDRPVRPDGRGIVLRGTLALVLGGMLGVFWAFGAEYVAGARETEPEEYREVADLVGEAREELARLPRRVRSSIGAGEG